jgi:hypothetical protein
VGVEIDNHGFGHPFHFMEEKLNGQGDVCVGTETPAPVATAVVEASAHVDGPATVHGQLARLATQIYKSTLTLID